MVQDSTGPVKRHLYSPVFLHGSGVGAFLGYAFAVHRRDTVSATELWKPGQLLCWVRPGTEGLCIGLLRHAGIQSKLASLRIRKVWAGFSEDPGDGYALQTLMSMTPHKKHMGVMAVRHVKYLPYVSAFSRAALPLSSGGQVCRSGCFPGQCPKQANVLLDDAVSGAGIPGRWSGRPAVHQHAPPVTS